MAHHQQQPLKMDSSPASFGFSFPEEKQNVAFYNTVGFRQKFSAAIFIIAFTSFLIYKMLDIFILRFLTVVGEDYKDVIDAAMERDNGALNKGQVGIKKAAYRRRLILASKKPQLYSTMPLNTNEDTDSSNKVYKDFIRVAQCDRAGDEESKKLFQTNYLPKDGADKTRRVLFGFYHPYSDANGGGEKVLWEAVYQVLKNSERNCAVIYTFTASNKTSVSSILINVKKTFGIDFFASHPTDSALDVMNDRIVFIQLNNKYRWFLDGSAYKRFTIIGQAFASFLIALWSLNGVCPDIWVDTMGLPFCYPLISGFAKIPIVSYVHYPLISSDMLKKLNLAKPFDLIKYFYWKAIIFIYALCASYLDVGLCNSTWTENHLVDVWKFNVDNKPTILYPPTGIDETKLIGAGKSIRDKKMLYIAQFRAEKRHDLVISEYAKYLEQSKSKDSPYTLVFIGSIRSDADKLNVEKLKQLATKLKVDEKIEFIVNAPRTQVDEYLNSCEVGLNAMWNEHFGITVVEYLFHGLIPIVHASAGPFQDIVLPYDAETETVLTPEVGLLDQTKQSGLFFRDPSDPDYIASGGKTFSKLSDTMLKFESLTEEQKSKMVANGHAVALKKFSKSVFEEQWQKLVTFIKQYEIFKRESKGKVEKYY